jgi:FKBP-type peptidyl-prolyl cis-trans isomerase 2
MKDINANQDCQQPPKQRHSDYSSFSPTVSTYPPSKLTNVLSLLPAVIIDAPGPLTRPNLQDFSATDSQLIANYSLDSDTNCSFSSDHGTVNSPGSKDPGSVTVVGLRPDTVVKLSGTCQSSDGQNVSFEDTFKTSLPKLPILPLLRNSTSAIDSVSLTFNDLSADGDNYEFQVSHGDILILGDIVQISKLTPGQTIDVNVKVSDAFGQSTEGKVATVKTLDLQPLSKPSVVFLKTDQGVYFFKFSKQSGLKYDLRAMNCVATIKEDQIRISNLQKQKLSSVILMASDAYGRSTSNKFFQLIKH